MFTGAQTEFLLNLRGSIDQYQQVSSNLYTTIHGTEPGSKPSINAMTKWINELNGSLLRDFKITYNQAYYLLRDGIYLTEMEIDQLKNHITAEVDDNAYQVVKAIADASNWLKDKIAELVKPFIGDTTSKFKDLEDSIKLSQSKTAFVVQNNINELKTFVQTSMKQSTDDLFAELKNTTAIVTSTIGKGIDEAKAKMSEIQGSILQFLTNAPEDIAFRIFMYFWVAVFQKDS